jgi:DNA-binding SARP family transcriptional activator
MNRLTRLVQGLLAVVATAALLIGFPLAMARWVGWPLPTTVPSLNGIADVLDRGTMPDAVVVNVLAVIAWLLWSQLAYAIVVEAAAAARGHASRRLHLLPGMQLLAGRMVASCALVITVSFPSARGIAAAPLVPVARPAATMPIEEAPTTAVAVRGVIAVRAAALSPAPPVANLYRTKPGDTWWTLAQEHLGDGRRWREIRGANLDRTVADGTTISEASDLLEAGWDLIIPTATPAAPGATVVARSHDHLWAVAQRTLADAWSRPPTDAETGPYWRQLIDANRDRLTRADNPSLIFAGQQFVTPPVPDDPHAPEPPPTATPPASATTIPPVTSATAPATPPSTFAPAPSEPPTTTTTPTRAPATPSSTAGLPSTTAGTPTVADGNTGAVDVDADLVLPALVAYVPGITGAMVLASGLLLAWRRARRRRAVAFHRSHTGDRTLERAVVAAADVPLVRWAGQELAELAGRLHRHTITASPVAVELSEQDGLELLWDAPVPDAPAPWEADAGGWAWRLLYDPEAPVPAPELPSPLAALVTIGRRDGRQLLLDLEAYGTIAVTGDAPAVEAWLRSVALELGAGDEIADAHVVCVGLDVDGAEHLTRVEVTDSATALSRLSAAAYSSHQLLAETDSATTFLYRLGDRLGAPLEATIALISDSDAEAMHDFIDAAPPRHGVAAILAGDVPEAKARIELRADGTGRLEPLAVDFEAVGVPRELAAQVAIMLDHTPQLDLHDNVDRDDADPRSLTDTVSAPAGWGAPSATKPPTPDRPAEESADEVPPPDTRVDDAEHDAISSVTSDATGKGGTVAPGDRDDEDEAEVAQPRLLIRVLGPPCVPERPALGARQTIVAAYLACAGRPVRTDEIQEAVWGGTAVSLKSLWNLVTNTRKALGELAPGEPVMGPTKRPENSIELAPGVWTDCALLRDLYERAVSLPSSKAVTLLRAAMDLIEGQPFAAEGYDWAHLGQYAAAAEAVIEQAATLLVDLALTAGDIDLARYAVLQGLRALPGNEALYRARMHIEDQAGNQAAIRSAYHELRHHLEDYDTAPSPATIELYQRLVKSPI